MSRPSPAPTHSSLSEFFYEHSTLEKCMSLLSSIMREETPFQMVVKPDAPPRSPLLRQALAPLMFLIPSDTKNPEPLRSLGNGDIGPLFRFFLKRKRELLVGFEDFERFRSFAEGCAEAAPGGDPRRPLMLLLNTYAAAALAVDAAGEWVSDETSTIINPRHESEGAGSGAPLIKRVFFLSRVVGFHGKSYEAFEGKLAALAELAAEKYAEGGGEEAEDLCVAVKRVFEEGNIWANRDDYYRVENSWLEDVVAGGGGIPLSLSLLFEDIYNRALATVAMAEGKGESRAQVRAT